MAYRPNQRESKRVRDLCAAFGDGWKPLRIDLELCAYRDYEDGYDVEVSGAASGRKDVFVYLWRNGHTIVSKATCPRMEAAAVADAMHEAAVGR